jgi:hypothetical protein
MGKAGRRKRDALEYEAFDGAGCSSGLQLELARNNESGYAGVSGPTTSGKWQAFVRVEREGKKVRRNVGSFDSATEAAVQRALALLGSVEVLSPSTRGPRSTGSLLAPTVASLAASCSHLYGLASQAPSPRCRAQFWASCPQICSAQRPPTPWTPPLRRSACRACSTACAAAMMIGSDVAAGGHAWPLDACVGVRLRAGVGRAGVGRAGVGCEQAWAERAWSTSKRAPYMQASAV